MPCRSKRILNKTNEEARVTKRLMRRIGKAEAIKAYMKDNEKARRKRGSLAHAVVTDKNFRMNPPPAGFVSKGFVIR
jgi:hypothetical protein